jgi:hypothetical protein
VLSLSPIDLNWNFLLQPIELWKSAFESYFGASPPLTAGVGAVPDLDPEGQFAEKDVDETRAQKEEELSLFRQVLLPFASRSCPLRRSGKKRVNCGPLWRRAKSLVQPLLCQRFFQREEREEGWGGIE